ncbi:hypothetical protein ES332_D02G273600v1 [Gossypium tomentosum]|uniref:GATA transcription factor n=1 Tax=Gossypium tomentosum TaxID=34277 RepID=A0A5D2M2F3_GOSTO|nr:hypothetical protein ES332_D02G273600v1 [Gossypium tomentosum]
MELCMEAKALKSSVRGEFTKNSHNQNQHVAFDDFFSSNGGVSSEEFSVDCFFDFTNGEFEEENEEKNSALIFSQEERVTDDDSNSNSSSFSFDSGLTNELSVPDDEIAGLEWVSQFVDDSFPVLPFSCPVFKQQTENQPEARFEPESAPVFVKTPCFSSPIPSKSRSKRAKPTGKTWPFGSFSRFESSTSSTTTASSSSTSSGFSISSTPTQKPNLGDIIEPPTKKQRRKSVVQSDGNAFQRRCSHCQVQKTPQWRTGPLGAKTLCNACGVRYKSGRLYPEYRPACSPTFSGDMHSNSHRKVLEMRKKKELAGKEPDELTPVVPSF